MTKLHQLLSSLLFGNHGYSSDLEDEKLGNCNNKV